MRVDEFDYELPPSSIAQTPLAERDAARLLVLARGGAVQAHARFAMLPELLSPGDLVVLNDTRVVRARLQGRKASGGRVELLLVEPREAGSSDWTCLGRCSRPALPGVRLELAGGLTGRVLARTGEEWTVRFDRAAEDVIETLEGHGTVPLPPYIHRDGSDRETERADAERYQTVFGCNLGAVAAPTAGLHFTRRTLERLAERGIETAKLTLHVGPGTFLPVRVERVEEHRLHAERYVLPPESAAAIARVRARGGRVVAVGTTVVRVLEHRATDDGRVEPGAGRCDLFIVPGFRFRVVDALVTNFHLPRSTLLMLVSAFGGREPVLAAYRQALALGYRFYSYGDAMLVA